MDPSKKPAPAPDLNRKVRLGLMDANSASKATTVSAFGSTASASPSAGTTLQSPTREDASVRPARRYEDEIKKQTETKEVTGQPPQNKEPEVAQDEAAPPSIEIERLGWFLARLQRAMTGDRRRRTGTTESWHRAMVTPELTISARNIKDEDAYMLDAVARILKKLLWEAWEE